MNTFTVILPIAFIFFLLGALSSSIILKNNIDKQDINYLSLAKLIKELKEKIKDLEVKIIGLNEQCKVLENTIRTIKTNKNDKSLENKKNNEAQLLLKEWLLGEEE